MDAWHERKMLDEKFPFKFYITDVTEFPPHWHEEIEIVYLLEETLQVGINNEVYTMEPRDILIIGMGDIHYYLNNSNQCRRIILMFNPAIFEAFAEELTEKKLALPLIKYPEPKSELSKTNSVNQHHLIEEQILAIIKEFVHSKNGYQLVTKARLYDLLALLIRLNLLEEYNPQEKSNHLKKLERLEQVFKFVKNNYSRPITLEEAATAANSSLYYFTRFFKDATGMTFINYLNNYRISKALRLLASTTDPITEIAFKTGFESIKTFNRVFKQIKACSPRQYRNSMSNLSTK